MQTKAGRQPRTAHGTFTTQSFRLTLHLSARGRKWVYWWYLISSKQIVQQSSNGVVTRLPNRTPCKETLMLINQGSWFGQACPVSHSKRQSVTANVWYSSPGFLHLSVPVRTVFRLVDGARAVDRENGCANRHTPHPKTHPNRVPRARDMRSWERVVVIAKNYTTVAVELGKTTCNPSGTLAG